MKRTTSIVLFASIFAVAVGTLGLSGNSATLMLASTPQSEPIGMLGHVEYKVLDESGEIVRYMQNDNIVVQNGKDCAAELLFGDPGDSTYLKCGASPSLFNYIGIGNGSSTSPIDVANKTLADGGGTSDDVTGTCSDNNAGVGTANGGEMARRYVTPTTGSVTATGSTGAIVVLDTSSDPFHFEAGNATSVIDSGVFNAHFAGVTNAGWDCSAGTSATTGGDAIVDWEMFSRQRLNGDTGITVNSGDSLSVKWTITVG